MRIRFQEFSPRKFSFHHDPVLVLEEFWTPQEQAYFQEAMTRTKWNALSEMPAVSAAFPNSGNWLKGEIGQAEAQVFLSKLSLPCIADYIESFPDIKERHLNFNFYSYGVGDCLPTHDDTDETYPRDRQSYQALRRIACATYFHDEWQPDWGGELIIYDARQKKGKRLLEIEKGLSLPCIADYIESFPDIKERHLNFNFYSYGVGDCLPTHDDTDETYPRDRQSYQALRRIACATYFHDEWQPDWGGELIIYDARQKKGKRLLEIKQCISPQPGCLALFTVPRFHRVCRVDAMAGPHKRLSIAGWFLTEHFT